MTAEDPVEYNLDGINQVNVHEEIGLTFAAALRAFLRQDPNIVMVGEIRDIETASIAVKAALTGHLVLSTLHTNDAPSTLNRLVDMGVEPFLVASSVNLIMAQRLIRRICKNCKAGHRAPSRGHRGAGAQRGGGPGPGGPGGERAAWSATTPATRAGRASTRCFPSPPAVRDMILDRAPTSEIRSLAIQEGMLTLRAHGLMKLKQGITSVEEVLKETAKDD